MTIAAPMPITDPNHQMNITWGKFANTIVSAYLNSNINRVAVVDTNNEVYTGEITKIGNQITIRNGMNLYKFTPNEVTSIKNICLA